MKSESCLAGPRSVNIFLKRASGGSNSDKESNLLPPPQSPYPALVEPSPVESHNSHSTEATEIDEEAQNHQDDAQGEAKSPDIEIISPAVSHDSASVFFRTQGARTPIGRFC